MSVKDAMCSRKLAELDDFAAACRTGEQPAISANDGTRVLKIMDAVVQSARMSKPIAFS